jgi:hypothetical protein
MLAAVVGVRIVCVFGRIRAVVLTKGKVDDLLSWLQTIGTSTGPLEND